MSSDARPSLISSVLIGVAGAVWVFLLAAIVFILVDKKPFIGNPLFTLGLGAAIVLTITGLQLRCRDQLAALVPPARRRPVVRQSTRVVDYSAQPDVTAEIPRSTGIYRATAAVDGSAPVQPVSDVLPSPSTVAAMRRLARKVTDVD